MTFDRKKIETLSQEMRDGWDAIDEAFDLLHGVHKLPADCIMEAHVKMVAVWLDACDPGRASRRYCYIGFFGDGSTATRMKVGLSKNPTTRLKAVATGKKPIWAFACQLADVKVAYKVEQAILEFYRDRRAEGEWVDIEATDLWGAMQLVGEAAKVARSVGGDEAMFFQVEE